MSPAPDYIAPAELVADLVAAGEKKARLAAPDMVLRGFMAGLILSFAASLSTTVVAQGMPPFAGALLFPVGFVILVLLGFELVTGNFALLPTALFARRIGPAAMLRSFGLVFAGNLLGSLFYALLFYLASTGCGAHEAGAVAELTVRTAEKKTLAYQADGGAGWATAFIKAVLCNCMVTLGTVMAFVSRSVVGKIAAMWLPILTFFALGFEHSVVNMYAIPAGMLFGAKVDLATWWLWNQLPVTAGNLLGGAILTGAALYASHRPEPARPRAPAREVAAAASYAPVTQPGAGAG